MPVAFLIRVVKLAALFQTPPFTQLLTQQPARAIREMLFTIIFSLKISSIKGVVDISLIVNSCFVVQLAYLIQKSGGSHTRRKSPLILILFKNS